MGDFISKILDGIEVVSFYLGWAVRIIEGFISWAPTVVQWVAEQMDFLQPRIDDDNDPLTGDQAREMIVEQGAEKFHGSGPVITKGDLRTIVDQLHKIRNAVRIGKDPYMDMEKLAVSKGYIKSEDLEMARKAWPGLQPLD